MTTQHYFDVFVASASYKAREPLTYHADIPVPIGSIVTVPLRKQAVTAVVVAKARRPRFTTKPMQTAHARKLPAHSIALMLQLLRYYPASAGDICQLFAPSYSITTGRADFTPAMPHPLAPPSMPPLTYQQQAVISALSAQPKGSFLLHGETGSGKTRILVECTLDALKRGQSALILSPEIGLSSQLAQDFMRTFGDHVVVAHSQLTVKQRREIWLTAMLSEQPRVFIGPRSALFLPIQSLGFIGVDEAHEGAYKQEGAPFYHAVPVAALLARVTQSLLVLASATPAVGTYYAFSKQTDRILRMTDVAVKKATKSTVIVVDMRSHDKRTKSEILSNKAIEVMKDSLQKGQQSLVFLNRRGSATMIFCQTCSWRAHCPVCDAQLTYHGDTHLLLCHVCGHQQPIPTSCPDCNNPEILFRGAGTKAVFDDIARLFPSARLARFDADNKKSESLYANLGSVRAGDVDIVIGTQMIAKGLDLPKLSCVIVVSADSGLLIPDFNSEERTYQQLHQVIGRVKRGHTEGTAIVQSYQPDNPVIQTAIRQDWRLFYQGEIQNRQKFALPPFRYLAQVSFSRKSARLAEQYGTKLKQQMADLQGIAVLGPAPHFHEKERGMYRWHIILRATARDKLIAACLQLPNDCKIDIDPISLL